VPTHQLCLLRFDLLALGLPQCPQLPLLLLHRVELHKLRQRSVAVARGRVTLLGARLQLRQEPLRLAARGLV
jgi:hypothetical protein